MKAIAYFSNGLGNFVLMMPALQALRDMSGEKVDVCLPDGWRDSRRPAVAEICDRWDVVDRVIGWPREQFDPRKYSHWFYSNHSSGSDVVQIFLQNRKHRPVPRPSWRDSLIHELDHYMEIVAAMGWTGSIPKITFPVSDEPDLSKEKKPVIGLCNGAFNVPYWRKKHWPFFEESSKVLKRYFGATIVGVGSKGELDGVPMDQDFCGKLSITGSARVISQCDLLVSTDTGCMHIADAMGIPTIALFGSTLISKNGPRDPRSIALMAGIDCAPCQDQAKFYRCERAACMESISIGDVASAAKEVMRNGTRHS